MRTSRSEERGYRKVQIFVAAPEDVADERGRLEQVIRELDEQLGDSLGIFLRYHDWKRVVPLVGYRSQQTVIDQCPVASWDYLILILWHRFGTPSGGINLLTDQPFRSGTEEEFTLAYELWKKARRPTILAYRCVRSVPDEGDPKQWQWVKDFFKEFKPGGEHPGLHKEYQSLDDFERKVRTDLEEALRSQRFERQGTSFSPLLNSSSTPSDHPPWDADITDVGWDQCDTETLRNYLEGLKIYDPTCHDFPGELDSGDPEEGIRQFLKIKGLLARDPDGEWRFTYAGAILFASAHVDLKGCHRAVDFYDHRRGKRIPFLLKQDDLPTYAVFSRVLEWLTAGLELPPEDSELPSEDSSMHYTFYPKTAIVEALVNWIAHRDYSVRGEGKITIRRNRVVFFNPGHSSEFEADKLINAVEPLRARQRKNPILVDALKSIRLAQREGGGMYRIRQALLENRSFHEARVGMDVKNDRENNTFTLTIYRANSADQETEQRLIALEAELQLAREAIQRLQQDLDNKEAALVKAQHDLGAPKFSEMAITINELQEKLKVAGEQIAGLHEDVSEKEKTIETLRSEWAKAEELREKVIEERTSIQRDLTRELAQEREKRISSLTQSLARVRSRLPILHALSVLGGLSL